MTYTITGLSWIVFILVVYVLVQFAIKGGKQHKTRISSRVRINGRN